MPESSALVTAIAAAVVGSVVAAMIPSVRRWVGALLRLCVRLGRSLLTKARSRDDAPTATEPTGDDTTIIHPDPKEPTGRATRFRAVGASEPQGTTPATELVSVAGTGEIAVRRSNRPLAGAEVLALFQNKTWVHALTDRDGVASLDLHSTHLPMTVFAAAEGCAAHAETG